MLALHYNCPDGRTWEKNTAAGSEVGKQWALRRWSLFCGDIPGRGDPEYTPE